MTAVVLFAIFLALVALRSSIIIAIGLSVVAALIVSGFSGMLWIIPMKVLENATNASLLAIPFFVLAGNLMNAIGITERIFNLANALVGHMRAGLAQVNVLASVLLAGGTGAAVADIAGLGAVEIRAMRERGYTASFASAITVVSAIVAPFIPPSVPLVVYAFLSNTSVARMFLAGLVPGLLVAVSLMLFNRYLATRTDFPTQPRATGAEVLKHARSGLLALVAPGIIMGGILSGLTTASEAGALASGYILLLGAFFRTLNWKAIYAALTETVLVTSMIMIIIGFAGAMGWLMAIEQIPQDLARALPELLDSRYAFLAAIGGLALVLGCFIDGVTIKLLLVPILLPLVDAFVVDRVHFGIVLEMSLIMGIATPPLGIGLFVSARLSGAPFETIVRDVLPYFIPLLLVLALLVLVPGFSLWLPNLVLGPV
ncbi:TRAP transporter large permease [Oricola thermophila]|uniref:TRAP transporter large permease protein n=1 Tax=Oricola thermophila TaxID=2742145 RepID=A0A6N1V969_9HYPH|nr:TRAP transporter large permease [Oricola thermophila]QKV17053.1 TRAP transporter large permease [Oricola thermophila]